MYTYLRFELETTSFQDLYIILNLNLYSFYLVQKTEIYTSRSIPSDLKTIFLNHDSSFDVFGIPIHVSSMEIPQESFFLSNSISIDSRSTNRFSRETDLRFEFPISENLLGALFWWNPDVSVA